MPSAGTPVYYFCRDKIKWRGNGKKDIFALQYDDSVSYGVAVERNRQNTAIAPSVVYVRNRSTLFGFSMSRGVWRCLFYLKGGRGALFSFWNEGVVSQMYSYKNKTYSN